MKSTSETGHAKNVANFQDLIEFVTGYGTTYDPSKNSLQLAELITLKTSADTALAEVITKNTAYNGKVNERVAAFSDIKSLATRLINALQTTDASPETIQDAKAFNRKIQGKTKKSPPSPEGGGGNGGQGGEGNEGNGFPPFGGQGASTSQQSYDQLIQHLAGLKSILETEPTYTPNETELQVATIEAKIADLTTKNTAVATAYTAVSNSRISRNQTLYTGINCLIDTANEVKKYIKSVFGANSPQFAQVKGIEFKKTKI
jgi:hypothetical protein